MNRVALLKMLMLTVLAPNYVCGQIPVNQDTLSLVSDWDFLGPDGVLLGLPIVLKEDHWVEETYVDEVALRRNGVRLQDIQVAPVRTSGVLRRSALRFLLSKHGLGFWSPSAGSVVITTKESADTMWADSGSEPSIEAILNGSLDARRNAVFMAAFYTIDHDEQIDALIECLQEPDLDLQFNAAFAIAQYGAAGARAAPHLGIVLHYDNLTVRESCAYALGKLGTAGASELVKILSDSDRSVSEIAAKGLAYHGSSGHSLIPQVVAAALGHINGIDLDDERISLLQAFANAIVSLDNGRAEATVAPLLKEAQPGPRVLALIVISYLGQRSELDVESYIQMLADENVYVRRKTAFALLTAEAHAIKSVSVLMRATEDHDPETRKWSRLVAAEIRPQTPKAIPQK